MTINDLWDWLVKQGLVKPRFSDKVDPNDLPPQKFRGSMKIDPEMRLKYYPMEPNPLAPTYSNKFMEQPPIRMQRRGTMPKPNMDGLDGLLYDIENADKLRKF